MSNRVCNNTIGESIYNKLKTIIRLLVENFSRHYQHKIEHFKKIIWIKKTYLGKEGNKEQADTVAHTKMKTGLSFNSNCHRWMHCASELPRIEPAPPAPGEQNMPAFTNSAMGGKHLEL